LGLEPAWTLLLACCCCIDIKQTPRRSEAPAICPQNPKHPQIQNFNPSALVPLAAGWHDAHGKQRQCIGLCLGTIALLETDQVAAELILEQGAVKAKRLWTPSESEGKGKERDEGMGCHWEGEELCPWCWQALVQAAQPLQLQKRFYKNVGDPEKDILKNLECEKIKKTFQAMKDRKRNLSKPPRRPRHT
jgi:hypothetical protein